MESSALDERIELLMKGTAFTDAETEKMMRDDLAAKLAKSDRTGTPLTVYCGFDPRTADLHLGHTIPMQKLRQFQQLGHRVVFLIGSATSMIGDPSDQDRVRAALTLEETLENGRTYAEQAFRLLDPEKTEVLYNHEWLLDLSLKELAELGALFTVQQFLQRETFRKRFDRGDPIWLHEAFYSLMQAEDARHLGTDVQVGGTDQLFNILAGRKLQKARGDEPSVGLVVGILPGRDGTAKMSKSLGNHIPLKSSPADMYGLLMSIPDSSIKAYLDLATAWLPAEVEAAMAAAGSGEQSWMDLKKRMALDVVTTYYDADAAVTAAEEFQRVVQDKGAPSEIPALTAALGAPVVDVIFAAGAAKSKGEARRLITQGGVRLDGKRVSEVDAVIEAGLLQVGKHRFFRVSTS